MEPFTHPDMNVSAKRWESWWKSAVANPGCPAFVLEKSNQFKNDFLGYYVNNRLFPSTADARARLDADPDFIQWIHEVAETQLAFLRYNNFLFNLSYLPASVEWESIFAK